MQYFFLLQYIHSKFLNSMMGIQRLGENQTLVKGDEHIHCTYIIERERKVHCYHRIEFCLSETLYNFEKVLLNPISENGQ